MLRADLAPDLPRGLGLLKKFMELDRAAWWDRKTSEILIHMFVDAPRSANPPPTRPPTPRRPIRPMSVADLAKFGTTSNLRKFAQVFANNADRGCSTSGDEMQVAGNVTATVFYSAMMGLTRDGGIITPDTPPPRKRPIAASAQSTDR